MAKLVQVKAYTDNNNVVRPIPVGARTIAAVRYKGSDEKYHYLVDFEVGNVYCFSYTAKDGKKHIKYVPTDDVFDATACLTTRKDGTESYTIIDER